MKKITKGFTPYKKYTGFTLIEMAVVLLIIGILAGIVLRNLGSSSVQARDTRRLADLRMMANYLSQYFTKQGEFPTASASSANNWDELGNTLSKAGIDPKTLPQPPVKNESYSYYPCSDSDKAPPNGRANHFILVARLEQNASTSPKLYENAVTTTPWQCANFSSSTCDQSQGYYCFIQ